MYISLSKWKFLIFLSDLFPSALPETSDIIDSADKLQDQSNKRNKCTSGLVFKGDIVNIMKFNFNIRFVCLSFWKFPQIMKMCHTV